jgi:ATP-dependent helicase/nuclease subunit B
MHPSSTIPTMVPRFRWVRYGRPAAQALRDEIASAKSGSALAPVTVVVTSNQVGVTARRLVGSGQLGSLGLGGTGLAAVSFVTPYRLAELLGARRLAQDGRRPASTAAITLAVRAALEDAPGLFAPVASHPATEAAFVRAYKELRECSTEALERVAHSSKRARDVVRLHLMARERLARSYYDEEDLIDAAISTLRAGGDRRNVVQPTIVYLPDRLSRHAARLLHNLSDTVPLVVLAGTTGMASADEPTRSVLRQLGIEASAPEDARADGPGALSEIVSAERTRIVTTSDADEEVRAALRAILDAARSGTPLGRIALLYPNPDPYARLVDEALAAAGIARNGAAATRLEAGLAARTLLGLFGLARAGWTRRDVFTWLASAPLHHDGRPVPVSTWEEISRAAGIYGGRAEWDRRLRALVAEEQARVAGAQVDLTLSAATAQRQRARERHAAELRRFVLALAADLEAASAQSRSWAAHARWALNQLDTLWPSKSRARWPLEELRSAGRLEEALERLASLEGQTDLDSFERTLRIELGTDQGRVGRLGEGVLVGPLSFGIGADLDLVIVLGMAEGSLPMPVSEDALLADHERAHAGEELAPRASIAEQHHALLACLASARRHLLLIPRGDLRRNRARVPSRWAVEVAANLEGRSIPSQALLEERTGSIDHVASFEDGLRRMAFPVNAQEHRLRRLLASSTQACDALGDPLLSAASAVLHARRSRALTRFDGYLAGLAVPSPADEPTSATSLERWVSCPFAYFLEHLLGVDAVENPEDRLSISPLDLGALIHEVLEHFVAEVLERPESLQPAPGAPWTQADRTRLLEIASSVCERYEAHGLVGRPLLWNWTRRRLFSDLERLLEEDNVQRAAARTRPVAVELTFGLPGAQLPAVELELPDGRTVCFRGKADRLDVAADGSVEILDYKTGRGDDYAELSRENPGASGRHLQLPVYALAARAHLGAHVTVRARYWFATSRGGFRRRGFEVDDEVLERFKTTIRHIVTGIEMGLFPNLPPDAGRQTAARCPYCDPDGLGVTQLRRQLLAKREDPVLAPLLTLLEPERAPSPAGVGAAREADLD